MKKPRILFLGNPGYGGLVLEELLRHDVEVVGVFHAAKSLWHLLRKRYRRYLTSRKKVTEAVHRVREKLESLLDKPMPIAPFGKDVTTVARRYGLRLFDGSLVTDHACHESLRSQGIDVIFVATFGEFLPLELLQIPKLAAINMHPSLLPKYRGGFPEFCAVYEGERVTGVTFHLMEEKFDRGRILLQRELDIPEHETTLSLKHRLSRLACEAIRDVVRLIASGDLQGRPQESSGVSYCRLRPNFNRITPLMTVREIQNIINACHDVESIGTPYFHLDGRKVQVLSYGSDGLEFEAVDRTIWFDVIRYKHRIYRGDALKSLATQIVF